MSHVELPRALEAYFAHAELDGVVDGRRFTITLPYFDGARLDRLQWWWSLSNAQLRIGGAEGIEVARRAATERFRQHIEYWLTSNRLSLGGHGPIPRLAARGVAATTPEPLDLPVPLAGSG
jgi:hypothetical protein